MEIWQILKDHLFDPLEHLTKDKIGLLIPSNKCPVNLLDNIFKNTYNSWLMYIIIYLVNLHLISFK